MHTRRPARRFRLLKLTITALVAIAFARSIPSEVAAQKVLRWKLQPGQQMQVQFDQDMAVTTSLMGNEMRSEADTGMVLSWDVRQVSSLGVAEIRQSIDRLTMKMHAPGSDPMIYDSAGAVPAEGIVKTLASAMDPLVGVEFTQQMSDRGEVLDVRLSPAAEKQLASAPTGAELQEIFSREGLKTLLGQAATVLPQGPVQPGDTWTGTSESNSPVGKLHMDLTYTYRGTEIVDGQPLERIDVSVDVQFGKQNNEASLAVAMTGQESHGTMYFDAEAGRFVSTEMRQKMQLETTVGEHVHLQSLQTALRTRFRPVPTVASRSIKAQPVSR